MKPFKKCKADGLIGNKFNQSLWIYTADCMPILFADKRKRLVAALHCGRKGLEKNIIKNLIKTLYKMGSSSEDIIVAVGPSISKENYSVDKKTLEDFYKNSIYNESTPPTKNNEKNFDLSALNFPENQGLFQLDLKKYAYIQLTNENIPKENIEISNLCTFNSKDFFSWRRTKTSSRQWNFICT